MGMDAEATIWVGVRSEDCDIEELIGKLPAEMFDRSEDYTGELWQTEDKERCLSDHGCLLNIITVSEEDAGLGISVFTHDWDFGAVEFNTAEIATKIADATLRLTKLFEKCGIEESIGVWCQTNWG